MSADVLEVSTGRPAPTDCSALKSRPVDSGDVQDRAQEANRHETVTSDAAGAPASGADQSNRCKLRWEDTWIRSAKRRRLAHQSPGQQSLNLARDCHGPPSRHRRDGSARPTSSRRRRTIPSTARITASNEPPPATDDGVFGDEERDNDHGRGHGLDSLPLREGAASHVLDHVAPSIPSTATSGPLPNSSSSTIGSSHDNGTDHFTGLDPELELGPAKAARKTSYTTCIDRSHRSSDRFSGAETSNVGLAPAGVAELPDAHRELSQRRPCLMFVIRFESGCTFATKMHDIFRTGVPKVADEQGNTASTSTSTPLKPLSKPVHPFFVAKTRRPTTHRSPSKQAQRTDEPQQILVAHPKPDGARTHLARSCSLAKPSTQLDELPSRSKGDRALDGPGDFGATPAAVTEPIWPPRGMVHARGLLSSQQPERQRRPPALKTADHTLSCSGQRKQKNRAVEISRDENIIARFARKLNDGPDHDRSKHASSSLETGVVEGQRPRPLRLPTRLVLRNRELQDMVRKRLSAPLPSSSDMSSHQAGYVPASGSVHPALWAVYQLITSSVTAFDSASCDANQWLSKYAPKGAAECLQDGQEVVVLRDWLLPLSLEQDPSDLSAKTTSLDGCTRRKRPRPKPEVARAEEMQDFIIESEDDRDEMDELRQLDANDGRPPHAKSLMRDGRTKPTRDLNSNRRPMNAVLLSGPAGCGKSAAVYAVADELGFQVFEINGGSRRNGKDVLDKVGDLARNHLVRTTSRMDRGKGSHVDDVDPATTSHTAASNSTSTPAPGPIGDFFKPESASKPKRHAKVDMIPSTFDVDVNLPAKQSRSPMRKDSVILLEEVDVLFEEDRQFWTTVVELLAQSRRPIVLTCNDENLVPIDDRFLHGILRFQPPPIALAVDYLLLVAAAEGHLLRRSAADALYRSKRHSLRASIMEMDFWCQMAVGDRKCGLEWMHLERFSEPVVPADRPDRMRVVSEDTYLAGMGWSSHDALAAHAADPLAMENVLVSDAWTDWEIDLGDWHDNRTLPVWYPSTTSDRRATCQAWDTFFDDLSSADIIAGVALATGNQVGTTSASASAYRLTDHLSNR